MLKRILLAGMVVFATAGAAQAASVTVIADGLTHGPGYTYPVSFTLRVYVSVSPADGTDTSLFGALVYPTSGIGPVTPVVQNALTGAFSTGGLSCNTSRCIMFSQTSGLNGPQSGNVTNFLISSQNYSIPPTTPLGTVLTWIWQTSPTTLSLDFFGATPSVPALSITVINDGPYVPEPGTAALLGLGLLGLAAARRRR